MQREAKKSKCENPADSFNFQFEQRIEVDGKVQYKSQNEVWRRFFTGFRTSVSRHDFWANFEENMAKNWRKLIKPDISWLDELYINLRAFEFFLIRDEIVFSIEIQLISNMEFGNLKLTKLPRLIKPINQLRVFKHLQLISIKNEFSMSEIGINWYFLIIEKHRMLANFHIPRLSNDMKIVVQKNHSRAHENIFL